MKSFIILVAILFLTACSSKQFYEMGRGHQRSVCIKNAKSEMQLNECEREAKERMSYEDYKKEAEAIKK